ncbi:MAG: hypothetical protein J5I53_04825 [Bradyrhizobiaceae bacterium]|nr:hypothetical protein [Bradyrhizobiaceae bacterium]
MRTIRLLAFVCLALTVGSCASIRDITNALTSLHRLQFKLANITNMRLAGVDVTKVSDPSRLSIADALSLTNAFTRGSLPATFTLNVEARNPNTGANGTKSTTLTLNDLDWRLLIDDVRTVGGNLERPIAIPGTTAASNIPLAVNVDLAQFFKDKGYTNVLNLALALGGANGSAARVKLDALPTVGTPFGPLSYPGRITIVDKEFSGS